MRSSLSVHLEEFNATKSPRIKRGLWFNLNGYSFGTVVVVPVVVELEVGEVVVGEDVVVQGVVLLVVPVVEADALGVVPLVLGVFAAEVVEPILLQSVEVPFVVVPVVGEAEFVDELLPSLGVVPIVEEPFWFALGVVPAAVPMPVVDAPAAVPMPLVEVLGLVCGVATLPLGVAVVVLVEFVVCPPKTAESDELLIAPLEVDCEVCPAPAGTVAVVPAEVWPAEVAPAAVPVVCAPANAVHARASVAVIKYLRMKQISCWLALLGLCRFR